MTEILNENPAKYFVEMEEIFGNMLSQSKVVTLTIQETTSDGYLMETGEKYTIRPNMENPTFEIEFQAEIGNIYYWHSCTFMQALSFMMMIEYNNQYVDAHAQGLIP